MIVIPHNPLALSYLAYFVDPCSKSHRILLGLAKTYSEEKAFTLAAAFSIAKNDKSNLSNVQNIYDLLKNIFTSSQQPTIDEKLVDFLKPNDFMKKYAKDNPSYIMDYARVYYGRCCLTLLEDDLKKTQSNINNHPHLNEFWQDGLTLNCKDIKQRVTNAEMPIGEQVLKIQSEKGHFDGNDILNSGEYYNLTRLSSLSKGYPQVGGKRSLDGGVLRKL